MESHQRRQEEHVDNLWAVHGPEALHHVQGSTPALHGQPRGTWSVPEEMAPTLDLNQKRHQAAMKELWGPLSYSEDVLGGF